MDKAIIESDCIGADALAGIGSTYADIVDPVLKRHKKTLEKIEKYNEQGKRGLARSLFRSSGLLDDLTEAIARAGQQASETIRRQRIGIMEVMADDDGTQAP